MTFELGIALPIGARLCAEPPSKAWRGRLSTGAAVVGFCSEGPEVKPNDKAAVPFVPISAYFLSVSRPTIRSIPRSLYAKRYRVGAHATTGHGPAVPKL